MKGKHTTTRKNKGVRKPARFHHDLSTLCYLARARMGVDIRARVADVLRDLPPTPDASKEAHANPNVPKGWGNE